MTVSWRMGWILLFAPLGCTPAPGTLAVLSPVSAQTSHGPEPSPAREETQPFELRPDGHIPQLPHRTFSVAASPDGQKLAYATPEGLFVGEFGKTTKRIFQAGGPIGAITWTGDGKHLVVQAADYQETLNPDGTKPTTSAPRSLVLISASDGASAVILPGASSTAPVASPDGKYIAVQGGLPADPEAVGLHLYDIQAGTWEVLVKEVVVPLGYTWAPDGSGLAFLRGQRPFTLATVNVSDRSVVPIAEVDFETPACGPFQAPYYWQGGGSTIATYKVQADRSIAITSYRHDGSEAEKVTLSSLADLDSHTPVICLHPAPSGAFFLGTRLTDVRQMYPTPADSMVRLSIAEDELISVAPPMHFAGWVGNQDKFIGYSQSTGKSKYYVIDLSQQPELGLASPFRLLQSSKCLRFVKQGSL